jgi:hypothetical protein
MRLLLRHAVQIEPRIDADEATLEPLQGAPVDAVWRRPQQRYLCLTKPQSLRADRSG